MVQVRAVFVAVRQRFVHVVMAVLAGYGIRVCMGMVPVLMIMPVRMRQTWMCMHMVVFLADS